MGISWIHPWVRNPETKGILCTNAWLRDIQNQALCDNECNQLETWLSQDNAFAKGKRCDKIQSRAMLLFA